MDKLTKEFIDSKVVSEDFHLFPGTTLTVCCLTLENGFTVLGQSACAKPEVFNAEIGKDLAREDAKEKIWQLEGYLFKQRLHEAAE